MGQSGNGSKRQRPISQSGSGRKEGAREKDDVDAVAAATDDYMILDVGRHMAMCSVGSTSLGNDLNPS